MLILIWLVILFSISYFYYLKLYLPSQYWKKRKVFYVHPLTRFWRVFFADRSIVDVVRQGYDEHTDKRYYGSYQFLQPGLMVRDIELVKKITVKDFDYFTDHMDLFGNDNKDIFTKNLFSLKGKDWREMRATLSPAFTSSKMKSMFLLISEAAKNFTEHFLKKPEDIIVAEMKETFSKYTNDVIATCSFGIKCDSLENPDNDFFKMGQEVSKPGFRRVIRSMAVGLFPWIFKILRTGVFPSRVINFFSGLIETTIETREKENIHRPDMIHLLMEAKKGKLKHESKSEKDTGFATVEESFVKNSENTVNLTNDVITAQALIFFFAGFETTSTILSFVAYELAVNPDVQAKLHKEIDSVLEKNSTIGYEELLSMKYLDQVLSEGLRKWSSGFALNRVCVKDYFIEPERKEENPLWLSKGCSVIIPVAGFHYDPQYFPNPEVFDPDRFSDENKDKIVPGSYFPFGVGPRNCIGSRFALLETKALLAYFMSKFEFTVIEKTPIPIVLVKSTSITAKGGLWLGLKKRNL